VILIEPYFDIYKPNILMCDGIYKSVPLKVSQFDQNISANDFKLDFDALESKITDNTKFIVLNSPHNPTGKVFTRSELEKLAAIVKKHPKLMVISDEVVRK
jgi:aspartate/methionine/tyrosine aminotransferase